MVRIQLGSRPTSGIPRSTRGISRSRFRLAFFLASSTSPSESMGLPQQTTSGRCTLAPAAAKSFTAPSPTSGRWYSFQVSLNRATSAGPAPCGNTEKRLVKVLFVTCGNERRGSIPARAARACDRVVEPGDQRRERELAADVSCCLLTKREAVFPAHLVEDFGLHAGDVHAGGTFGLARLAADAEVHDLLHALSGQLLRRKRAFDHGPQHVGPRPRGVLPVEGHHVGWAHRASCFLAAEARSEEHTS